jgi:valyl-tRNA synthetase
MHGPSEANSKLDHQASSLYAVEVLSCLNETIDKTEAAYREYRFNEVAQSLYDFFWNDYCDWFVEAAKTEIFAEEESRKKSALAVMDVVLSAVLRLLHPFMPHITEELWSILGFGKGSIQFERPPEAVTLPNLDVAGQRRMVAGIYEAVQAGRNLRAEAKVPSNKKVRFLLRSNDETIAQELPTLARLLNAEEVKLDPQHKPESGVPMAVTSLGEIYLADTGADKAAERERLDKEIARVQKENPLPWWRNIASD